MRNYEIEATLHELTGEEHMVAELCPFNGVYCKWGSAQGLDPTPPPRPMDGEVLQIETAELLLQSVHPEWESIKVTRYTDRLSEKRLFQVRWTLNGEQYGNALTTTHEDPVCALRAMGLIPPEP